MVRINDFDLKGFEKALAIAVKAANKKFPKKPKYFVAARFWQDGDFEILLTTSSNLRQHTFQYNKNSPHFGFKVKGIDKPWKKDDDFYDE